MNSLLRNLGGMASASLLLSLCVGCGGSGSSNSTPLGPPASVTLSGGVVTQSGSAPFSVTANGAPQPISLYLSGATQPTTVWIPAGISLSAGQSISIIPAKTAFIGNLTTGTTAAAAKAITKQTSAGMVTVNSQASGVTLQNGLLSAAIGLPAGNYTLVLQGPFNVTNANSNPTLGELTVGEFIFTFESNGIETSLPTSITGTIPSNGASTLQNPSNTITLAFNPSYVTTPNITTFSFTDANGVVTQTDGPQSDGTYVIHDYFSSPATKPGLQIPSGGVDSVSFTH